jgi:exopolyphosphatase/pppGpp-phosphohydrolase
MSGEESTAAGKPRADAHSWQAMGVISIGSNDIHLLVDTLPPLPVPPQRVVAMGGSADHLVRLTSHPKHWRLTASALDKILVTLQKKTASETARKYELPVPRARLLPAGAVILRTLLAHYGSEVAEVKENGIRGAVVVSYARHGTRWRRSLQGR